MLAVHLKRLALAVLGVVLAIAILVAITRQNAGSTDDPRTLVPEAAPVQAAEPVDAGPDPTDVPLDVREYALGDGSDRTSIRIEHPDPVVQQRLRDFLAAHEQVAAAVDCHAKIARVRLISITCVTTETIDAGDASTQEAKYESLTLRVPKNSAMKELKLADVLTADAGQTEVVEACKKVADPDLACEWPPTDFAITPGGTLFLCHGAHCVDIDADDAPNLLRPEYR
jgi:hypothetical protein